MTDTERSLIQRMRRSGSSAAQISAETGLSENTIKSFCRRNDIRPVSENVLSAVDTTGVCKFCGKLIEQNAKGKKKKFCSDTCRISWWNVHPEQLKSAEHIVCANCRNTFNSYGRRRRKYCSHGCYVAARYSGGISN